VPVHEGVIELVDDLVVHRAAELRMGMQHDADRRVLLPGGMVAPLDAPGGAGENNLGHECSNLDCAIDPPEPPVPVESGGAIALVSGACSVGELVPTSPEHALTAGAHPSGPA